MFHPSVSPRSPRGFPRFRSPFSRLQTRLTLSFVAASVAGTIVVVLILMILSAFLFFRLPVYPISVQADLNRAAPMITRRLKHSLADFQEWADEKCGDIAQESQASESDTGPRIGIAASTILKAEGVLTDPQGRILATTPQGLYPAGSFASDVLPPDEVRVVRGALRGETDASKLSGRGKDTILATVALRDETVGNTPAKRSLLGVVLLRLVVPFRWDRFLMDTVSSILWLVMIVGFCSLISGSIFGLFMARRLTGRLVGIAEAADAWSVGQFAARAPENGDDELSILSQRLNQMARDFSDLLALRQDVATLEERNRLARDLHDTVKQQVFAVSMQIGAARSRLPRDTEAAQQHLRDAENLMQAARHELTTLLQELRPAYQENRSLAENLRELILPYERQTGIVARLTISAEAETAVIAPRCALALLRIAQEALSNVARHSGASEVTVTLVHSEVSPATITLTIADDGQGFVPQTDFGTGMGLSNMKERAEQLPGGCFTIESTPGRGTRITVSCETK